MVNLASSKIVINIKGQVSTYFMKTGPDGEMFKGRLKFSQVLWNKDTSAALDNAFCFFTRSWKIVAADLPVHIESLLLLYNVTDCGCEQKSLNRWQQSTMLFPHCALNLLPMGSWLILPATFFLLSSSTWKPLMGITPAISCLPRS